MIELLIPQIGEDTKNAKDIVFSILTSQHPLSTMQIFRIVNKQHNVGLTYPAIKKAIDSLVSKKVLTKEKLVYQINKEWLFRIKSVVDELITSYESGIASKTPSARIVNGEYAVYTFTNLFDLDNFWDDLLINLCDNLKPNEPRDYLAYIHYAWFLLINLGRETKLFEHLIKKKVKCRILFIGKSAINKWAKKIYEDAGVSFKLIENKSLDDSIAFNLIGDTVIQVKYPEELIRKFDEILKSKSIEEISSKEIAQFVHEKFEIKLNVFRNPEIARSLKERYNKYF